MERKTKDINILSLTFFVLLIISLFGLAGSGISISAFMGASAPTKNLATAIIILYSVSILLTVLVITLKIINFYKNDKLKIVEMHRRIKKKWMRLYAD